MKKTPSQPPDDSGCWQQIPDDMVDAFLRAQGAAFYAQYAAAIYRDMATTAPLPKGPRH